MRAKIVAEDAVVLKRIVPGPIEWSFAKNNYVEQVCVAGLGIPQPLALVVLSDIGKEAEVEKLRQSLQETLDHINSRLPNYEQLKTVVVFQQPWSVENGCLTPTMKIKRSHIETLVAPRVERWYADGHKVLWA